MTRCPRVLLAVGVLLVSHPAFGADDEIEQAKSYFEAGKRAYKAGQYEAAIAAFGEADQLAPRAAIAFSLAQAYRLQYFVDKKPSRLKRAVELYRRYLDQEPRGARREDAAGHVATLEPMLVRIEGQQGASAMVEETRTETQLMVSAQIEGAMASIDGAEAVELPVIKVVEPGRHKVQVQAAGYFPKVLEKVAVQGRLIVVDVDLVAQPAQVSIQLPPGAEVAIGGRPFGTAPFAGPVELPAGRHYVTITQSGRYPHAEELVVDRGASASLSVELETTAQRKVAYGFLASSAAAAVAGGVTTALGFVAEGQAKDIQAKLDGGQNLTPDDADEYQSQLDRRDAMVVASVALFSGAVVTGVTGLLLYTLDHERAVAPAPSLLQVAPVVDPEGMGVRLFGRF